MRLGSIVHAKRDIRDGDSPPIDKDDEGVIFRVRFFGDPSRMFGIYSVRWINGASRGAATQCDEIDIEERSPDAIYDQIYGWVFETCRMQWIYRRADADLGWRRPQEGCGIGSGALAYFDCTQISTRAFYPPVGPTLESKIYPDRRHAISYCPQVLHEPIQYALI